MLAIARKCVYVYTPERVYVLAFDNPDSVCVYDWGSGTALVTVTTDKAKLHVNRDVVEAIIYSKGGN